MAIVLESLFPIFARMAAEKPMRRLSFFSLSAALLM